MIRSLMVVTATAAIGVAGATGVAGAEPGAPKACSYTLSPPHLVQVSGVNMVSATLTPAACNRSQPYLLVACIQLQGSDGPEQCAQNQGLLPAQVYYQPYRPGATYVSSGRGCASTGNPPIGVCQPIAPSIATL
jgi:hypothetical protein